MEEEQHHPFYGELSASAAHVVANSSDNPNDASSYSSRGETRQFFMLSNVHHPSLGGGLATVTQQVVEDTLSQKLLYSPRSRASQLPPAYHRHQQQTIASSISSLPVSECSDLCQQPGYSLSQNKIVNSRHINEAISSSPQSFLVNNSIHDGFSERLKGVKSEESTLPYLVNSQAHNSFSFLDKLVSAAVDVSHASEDIAQTCQNDQRLLRFVQTTSQFAQTVQMAVNEVHAFSEEVNKKVINQTAILNGLLLRRGGTGVLINGSTSSVGSSSKSDKIVFNLARCDRGRKTIYDQGDEANQFEHEEQHEARMVDLVEIFDKFFKQSKGPKYQSAEELATILTEFVLGTIYSEQTEKWTYCVRYSSRNGHKCVPHALIEEIKTQLTKGFGVYGSAGGSQLNLAIGSAVVNKATRFFNAKRRVSTRANLRKLAGCSNTRSNADSASNKSFSSVDIEQEVKIEENQGNPSIAETIDAVANNIYEEDRNEVKAKKARVDSSNMEASSTALDALTAKYSALNEEEDSIDHYRLITDEIVVVKTEENNEVV